MVLVSAYNQFILLPELCEPSGCSASSPTLYVIYLFFFSHFVGCLVILNCGFNLYFSGNSEVQHLFHFLLAICIPPL